MMNAIAAVPVASRFEPALKPNQPTQRRHAPIIVSGRPCGGMDLAVADTLAEQVRSNEARHAGIDMHDCAACKSQARPSARASRRPR